MTDIDALKADLAAMHEDVQTLKADVIAHQMILSNVTAAWVVNTPDWRKALEGLHNVAQQSVSAMELVGGDDKSNEKLRRAILWRLDEHFSAILAELTAMER